MDMSGMHCFLMLSEVKHVLPVVKKCGCIESYEYYDGGMDNEPYFRHNGQNADSQEVLDALNDYEVQSIMLEITEYRE